MSLALGEFELEFFSSQLFVHRGEGLGLVFDVWRLLWVEVHLPETARRPYTAATEAPLFGSDGLQRCGKGSRGAIALQIFEPSSR